MTDIAKDFDVATDDDLAADQSAGIGEFLASHGGPFFELQRRVGVLEEDAAHTGRRAAIVVALAWGVPLLLSLLQGHAFGPQDSHPYLLDFGAWARFFIATGLFLMAEQQVEYGLRGKLGEFVRAPLLAPKSFKPAAEVVVKALKLRNSGVAEVVCLGLAIAGSARVDRPILLPLTPRPGRCRSQTTARMVDAGGMVGGDRQRADLLFPADARTLALSRMGDAALASSPLLKLRACGDPSGRQGGSRFSRRISEAYSMFVFGLSASMAITVVRARVRETTSPRSRSAISSRAGLRSYSRFSPFRCWRSRSRCRRSRNGRFKILAARATLATPGGQRGLARAQRRGERRRGGRSGRHDPRSLRAIRRCRRSFRSFF